jgi:hypothetical protein
MITAMITMVMHNRNSRMKHAANALSNFSPPGALFNLMKPEKHLFRDEE